MVLKMKMFTPLKKMQNNTLIKLINIVETIKMFSVNFQWGTIFDQNIIFSFYDEQKKANIYQVKIGH